MSSASGKKKSLANLNTMLLCVVKWCRSHSSNKCQGISFHSCISVSSAHPSQVDASISVTTGSIKSFKEIPGPSSLPFFGPLLNFLPGGILYNLNRSDMFKKLHKIYGPIVRLDKLANQPNTLMLFDAESIGTIFRGEESGPRRALIGTLEMYRQKYNKQESIGVLINGTGPEWKKVRSPANKAMMVPKLVQASYSKIIEDIAREAVERLDSVRNEKGMIAHLDDEVKLWTMETIGAVTLGQRLNCFNRELSEDSYEKRLIFLIQTVFDIVETVDFEHNFKSILLGEKSKVMKTFRELERVILYFFDKTVKEWESKKDKGSDEIHACTVEKMLYKNKPAAVEIAIDSLLAGIDAVSQAMLFLLHLLGTHPDKQLLLRKEIFSEKDQKLYLRACIKESSRIMPTAFANTRVTTKSHEVMGYRIPKDILVVVPQQIVSTMEGHYPRATEFLPERWLVEEDHHLYHGNASPFTHMPFGFGIRTCLGRRIVDMMMESLAVQMVKTFDIIWEGPPPKTSLKAINKMHGPYRFVFKRLK